MFYESKKFIYENTISYDIPISLGRFGVQGDVVKQENIQRKGGDNND